MEIFFTLYITQCFAVFFLFPVLLSPLGEKMDVHKFAPCIRLGVLGPVAQRLVSANRWLRGIKTYRFPWYLTLVSANHASSNPGQGAYLIFGLSGWALIRGGRLLNFHHFQ